jgi:hypothetical protein
MNLRTKKDSYKYESSLATPFPVLAIKNKSLKKLGKELTGGFY